MRDSIAHLLSATKQKRLLARDAMSSDRRTSFRGTSDVVVFLERKLHRATAALEQHLATHGCQE